MSTSRPIAAVVAIVALLAPAPASADPDVGCAACIVIDGSGRVLWSRNAQAPRAIASATKIMTALIVRAEADLTDEVTVSGEAAGTSGGKLSLEAGEVLSVEELLWGMLLNSSNDAAVALAEHIGGSEDAFVERMNAHAKALGLAQTAFTTAHGLDEVGHHSSASDLARLTLELLSDDLLAEMVATIDHEVTSSTRTIRLENTNLLLEGYDGAVGVKTGFTSEAGNVLVAAARRDGRLVVTVALGSVDHFGDSVELLDHGFRIMARSVLVPRGAAAGLLFTDSAGGASLVTARVLRGYAGDRPVTERVTLDAGLKLPIGTGQRVGSMSVRIADEAAGRVSLISSGELDVTSEPLAADLLARLLGTLSHLIPGEG